MPHPAPLTSRTRCLSFPVMAGFDSGTKKLPWYVTHGLSEWRYATAWDAMYQRIEFTLTQTIKTSRRDFWMWQTYKNRQKRFIPLPSHVLVSKVAIELISAGSISNQKVFVISASQNMRTHGPAFASD